MKGKCFDRVDYYYCHCEDGYTGRDCDVNINECQSYPCVNGKQFSRFLMLLLFPSNVNFKVKK